MLFYAYGPAHERLPGPCRPTWNPTGPPWDPTGSTWAQKQGIPMLSYAYGSAHELRPDGPRSKKYQCISMHLGLHRKGCRVRVSPHGSPLAPHWAPPDPHGPGSKECQCFSMHMDLHTNGCRVRVSPHEPHWIPVGSHRMHMGPEARNANAFLCIWVCTRKVAGSA